MNNENTDSDKKSWFRRHKILTGLLVMFGLFILLIVAVGASDPKALQEGYEAGVEGEGAQTASEIIQAAKQEKQEETDNTAPPTSASDTDTQKTASRCEKPSDVLIETIESGLTTHGAGSLRNAYAVHSSDFQNMWFVAADIQAAGIEGSNDIGVWAVNAIDGSGSLIFAADAVAREFSEWGTAGDFSERNFSSSDDGFSEAVTCARG